MQAGDFVGDQRRQITGPRITVDAREKRSGPRSGLDDVVICLQIGIGAILAETDAVYVYDVGVHRTNAVVIQAETLRSLAADVKNEHVRARDQCVDRGKVIGLF